MTLPWVSFFYAENVSNAPLTFTLRKFIENPALIALLSSINVAFNLIVGVFTNYMSDRIWTRWGRRRPFLIVGWLGVAVMMALVPLAPNFWTLVVIIVAYQFFADVAKPLEALTNEVIPAAQRGRAATARNMAQNIMNLFFYGVMIAQFDATYDIDALGRAIQLRGDAILYWTGSLALLVAVAFLVFCVRETPPAHRVVRERFAFRSFFRETFGQRQWWTVYLLYAIPILVLPGIHTFEPLMRTEQFGFSKAEFGGAVTIGGVINLLLFIPLAGYLTDRMPRLRLMQLGIVAMAVVSLAFFCYLRYVADYSISLMTLIGFSLVATLFKMFVYVCWTPLVYDYIPSDRFGTVSAGLAFVGGLAPFVLINLAGLWVNGFTYLFGTRGGSTHDYSSIYVLQAIAVGVAFVLTLHIAREQRIGRLVPYGRLEMLEQQDADRGTAP